MKLTTGYKKPIASSGDDALELTSNNSYLLLAGGGHKALSELVSPADLTNYVTIGSNQTITGVKTFSLAINADITGNADTVDNMHASDFATANHTHSDTFKIENHPNYVALQFRDPSLSQKASETFITCWGNNGGWWNWKANKWIKVDSSDDYVLLGGGGHKKESSLSVNYAASAGNASSVDWNDVTNKPTKVSQFKNDAGYVTKDTTATSDTLGLVKIGYTATDKNYPVQLSNGQMYVNVPWTDTKTWSGITGKPNLPNFVTYLGSLSTSGWKQLNGKGNDPSIAIALNNSAAAWNSGTYSATMVWGCFDTRGFIDCGHSNSTVIFGGGSYAGSTDDSPTWYWKLNGISGCTYTLPSDSKTLAAADGSNASGTWSISISGNAATASSVNWKNVVNRPTSLPASDVYAWAKAKTKPSYSWSEITSRPTKVSQFTNDAGYITDSDAKFGNYLPLSGGTVTGQLYLTGLEEGTLDVTDNTELLTSYASNDGFGDTNATGKVYRRDAIKVYNYIKGKLDSVYSAIGHTHTTLHPTYHGNHIVIDNSGWNSVNILRTNYTSELGDYTELLVPGGGWNSASIKLITNGNVLIGTWTDTGHKLHVAGDVYTTTGFKKEGSTDSYVLLGGGGHKSLSDFVLKSDHAGDMYETDDAGYADSSGNKVSDYCRTYKDWLISPNPKFPNCTFTDLIEVPVPSILAMDKLADCIRQMKDILLLVGENIINSSYLWSQLHWLKQCSRTDCIVYTTKYAIIDAKFPSVVYSNTTQTPPTTIEISVSYDSASTPVSRYVQVVIENLYGRAYYKGKDVKSK